MEQRGISQMEGKKLDFSAPLLSVRVKRKVRETPLPHRQLSVPSRKSILESNEVTKPAAVPFVWEHTPGRPKDEAQVPSPSREEPSMTPRFPPGRAFEIRTRVSGELFEHQNVLRPQTETSPLDENMRVVDMSEDSASENEDNAFSGALDTLSVSDSCSWSCSISGSSGYDGPTAKPSGIFRADPETRDLMMSRFLPAARAMIIETPKYVRKKKSSESESPRDVRKIVSGELRPLLERYVSNSASHHSYYKGNASSDVDDDEYDDRIRRSSITCGLLPRLSVKNSLRLSSPVPKVKSRSQSPISSVPEVRRMARTVHSGPLPQIHHEKEDRDDTYWNNIQIGAEQQEFLENMLNGISNQARHSMDSHRKEGLSPGRRSRNISPYLNEKPQSPFRDGARFLGIPKIVKNSEASKLGSISGDSDKFLDISSDQIYKRESVSSLAENTLFIDSIRNTEMQIIDSASLEAKMLSKHFGPRRGIAQVSKLNSFDQVEKIVKSSETRLTSSSCLSTLKGEADNTEVLKDQDIGHDLTSLQCSIEPPAENLATQNGNSDKVNAEGNANVGFQPSPQPPPLPKSPSEPWLWRTLPFISLQNPFSYGQSKKQALKKSSTGSKWETIVKASNVWHNHKRYSDNLISHVSQHSKS